MYVCTSALEQQLKNNCHFRAEAVHTYVMDYEGSNCRGMGFINRPHHAFRFRCSPKTAIAGYNRPRIPTGMLPVGVSRAPEPSSSSRGRDCGTYRPMRFIGYYTGSLSGASSSRFLLAPIDTI